MTNIKFLSIIKQKMSFDHHRDLTKEIPEDIARIKKSLVSAANDLSTNIL